MRLLTISAMVLYAALSATASAQNVTLRGEVEDVSGTGNQFIVKCTDTSLTSSAFDLNLFVDQHVELSGNWNGSTASPVVDVTAIVVVAKTFEIGGNGKIGGDLKFEASSTPGDFAIMFASFDSGFGPTRRSGTLLISPTPLLLISTGFIPGGGVLEIDVDVPDNPALIGFQLFGQTLLVLSAGGSHWSDPDCVTIDS